MRGEERRDMARGVKKEEDKRLVRRGRERNDDNDDEGVRR